MSSNFMKIIKYGTIFTFVFVSIIACEKDIENVGVNLINRIDFNSDKFTTDVTTSTHNIEKVRADNLSQYLLGVYKDDDFGKIKASIVTQLSLASTGLDFGVNPTIDTVLLSIPYQATTDTIIGGISDFSLDSIIGDVNVPFTLKVYELGTFLNSLNPDDPSQTAKYYSDKVYQKIMPELYSGDFKPNKNDTVAYVKRWNGTSVYDIDTIKSSVVAPIILIPLDENRIKDILINNPSGTEFDSFQNFIRYFRGIYIEAIEGSNDKSNLMSLSLANANITVYYTNEVEGEKTAQSFTFALGLRNNIIERDYTGAFSSGADKIYVQGAAGTDAVVEILGNQDLDELRNNNWLINDASLTFYINQNATSNIIPEQLYIYNYDSNSQLIDVFTEGVS